MTIYNKLVRDRIPEIIKNSGKKFSSRILNKTEYIHEVNKKMHEELAEYEEAQTNEEAIEELADLLELIHAATAFYNTSIDELEMVRVNKLERRGGFSKRIYLMDVIDD